MARHGEPNIRLLEFSDKGDCFLSFFCFILFPLDLHCNSKTLVVANMETKIERGDICMCLFLFSSVLSIMDGRFEQWPTTLSVPSSQTKQLQLKIFHQMGEKRFKLNSFFLTHLWTFFFCCFLHQNATHVLFPKWHVRSKKTAHFTSSYSTNFFLFLPKKSFPDKLQKKFKLSLIANC